MSNMSIPNSREKSIPIMVAYRGKSIVAGNLTCSGVFKKTVEQRDKLLVLDAYGFDVAYMRDVMAQGCKLINLRVKDTGENYRINIKTFKEKAVIRSIGKFPQRMYVPLRYWQPVNPKPRGPVQLALM